MLIIINEDSTYVSWINHHRDGFVLDTRRKPTKKNMMLHRATCCEIRSCKSKRTHWTTGRRIKVCSCDAEELQNWAREVTGDEPTPCDHCVPNQPLTSEQLVKRSGGDKHHQLTKLGSDILCYIVEVAIINLDNATKYDTTVGEVAEMLSKTPAQITAALIRLIEDGFVAIPGEIVPGKPIPAGRIVYPTPQAFENEPAFAKMSVSQLNAEIEKLRDDVQRDLPFNE